MPWDYNRQRLQGLTIDVCGKYCCLIALYMDPGYTPQQFISLLNASTQQQTSNLSGCSLPNSGPRYHVAAGVNADAAAYER